MNVPAQLWADPRLVYTVATAAVALLLATIWLFRRRRRSGRQAGMICLVLSIVLHAALILLVPLLPGRHGGSSISDSASEEEAGIESLSFSTFDPDMDFEDSAGEDPSSMIAPLPVANLTDLIEPVAAIEPDSAMSEESIDTEPIVVPSVPTALAAISSKTTMDAMEEAATEFDELLDDAFASVPVADVDASKMIDQPSNEEVSPAAVSNDANSKPSISQSAKSPAPAAIVPGSVESDFANRVGRAKEEALLRTGGDANTEAAVEAALRFLADSQRPDGAWDPRASGAGKERSPLGMARGGAGMRAETAITGLALLSFLGSGQTHRQGEYSDNVYRGLVYLIRKQKPNGSLAGDASLYAANYSHGMASLAMGETAAITADPTAVDSATRAIRYTLATQHPSTGGWRYSAGDPGDLSQLGWQAMVLDAGHRSGVAIDRRSVVGVERFLASVRSGSAGGLACYRPGEAVSRTMTAESLATRLLIGHRPSSPAIAEAQRYLLQQPPGVGPDNYYYWYYATLALHQLQDDAWQQWNAKLKDRLLATQRSDGSWSSDTLWGGYGGTVYTTSMAALCLEVYYRHTVRADSERIANRH